MQSIAVTQYHLRTNENLGYIVDIFYQYNKTVRTLDRPVSKMFSSGAKAVTLIQDVLKLKFTERLYNNLYQALTLAKFVTIIFCCK